MSTQTTTIKGVQGKTVRRKSDNTEMVIYEITDGNGVVWATTRKAVANEAHRLTGQQVYLEGKVEVNGVYENHYLESVRAIGSGTFLPPEAAVAPLSPQPVPMAPTPAPPPLPAPTPLGAPTPTDRTIWRQTAAKVSANISANPEEFWANLDSLVHYFETGEKPTHQFQQVESGFGPTAPDGLNRFVPQSAIDDPGPELGKPEFDDSDVPF